MSLASIIAGLLPGNDGSSEWEKRKKFEDSIAADEAQKRALYGNPQLNMEWNYRNAGAGDLTSKSAINPEQPFVSPTAELWRWNPQGAQYVNQQNAEAALLRPTAQFKNRVAKEIVESNYPKNSAISSDDYWRTYQTFGSFPSQVEAEKAYGAIGTGKLGAIGATTALTQDREAQIKLDQAKEEERLKMGQQRAQLEAARNAAAIPNYNIQRIGDEAVLNDPKAIAELAINRNKLEGSNIATTIADNAERGKLRPYKTQYELSNMARQQKENQVAGITQDELLANPQLLRDVATKGLQRQLTIDTYGGWPDERQSKFFTLNKDGTFSVKDNPYYDDPLKAILGNADPLNNAASSVSSIKLPAKPVMTSFGMRAPIGGIPPGPAKPVVPSAPGQRPVIDADTAQQMLTNYVKTLRQPGEDVIAQDTFRDAVRSGLAGKIAVPDEYIGSSVFRKPRSTALLNALNNPAQAAELEKQINNLPPEVKSAILYNALSKAGVSFK